MRRFALPVLFLALVSCDGSAPVEPMVQKGRVFIEFPTSESFTLAVGSSLTLRATVLDLNGQQMSPQPEIEFRSSVPGLLDVTPAGQLTALSTGEARVIAEVRDASGFSPDSVGVSMSVLLGPALPPLAVTW